MKPLRGISARMRSRRAIGSIVSLTVIASLAPVAANSAAEPVTSTRTFSSSPVDRYEMAGACYAIRSRGGAHDGEYVTRAAGGGFGLTATAGAAEPFLFQATDLGSYLLYGTPAPAKTGTFAGDFLAASDGAIGEAADAAKDSTPGGYVSGLSREHSDAAADAASDSAANTAAGRGAAVIAAASPSELADWVIDGDAPNFHLTLDATGQALVAADGKVGLAPASGAGAPSTFGFEFLGTQADPTGPCNRYPEIQVNVTGDPHSGDTPYEETLGYVDPHLHLMAYEFIGGRSKCGRPWHRFGAPFALVDCPDHEPGGYGAALENVVSNGSPVGSHNTDGWPTFTGWPKPGSLIHEQVYYKWLERVWRSGLRMMTLLLVDNNQLCEIWPYRRNTCNEMETVRIQAQRTKELMDYIDAQSGGPGRGWFRVVTDPFTAREVINEGKLAVVMGIEVSRLFDCRIIRDIPDCDGDDVNEELDAVYNLTVDGADLGVRQMELVNKFDNAFSGVTGDAGATGIVVNQGNFGETGQYWQFETCDPHADAHSHDKLQLNIHDSPGSHPLSPFTERDSLVAAILQLAGRSGASMAYPPGPHCNVRGLTALGEYLVRQMMAKGMLFDPDHMSARARRQAMSVIESAGYNGVVSSHSWADDVIYRRILKAGGFVGPSKRGNPGSFYDTWKQHRDWADDRFVFGLGFGSDVNGYSSQPGPRSGAAVSYPVTGLGGVQIHQQVSGTKTYNYNADGVPHYGLYAEWFQDVFNVAGTDAADIKADMQRAAEAFLQTWERAVGISGDACRADVADLSGDDMSGLIGKTPQEVLEAVGQPSARVDATFTYCVGATTTPNTTVTFDSNGLVQSVT